MWLSINYGVLRFYCYALIWLVGFYGITDPTSFSWYYAWFMLTPIFIIVLLIKLLSEYARKYKQKWFCVLSALIVMWQIDKYAILNPFNYNRLEVRGIRNLDLINSTSLHGWAMDNIARLCSRVFIWGRGEERQLLYIKCVDYLKLPMLDKTVVLACKEPGLVGFNANRFHVLDLGGLLSDEILKFLPVPVDQRTKDDTTCIAPEAVDQLVPNYLITFDSYCRNGLFKDAYFMSHYRLLAFWPLSWQVQHHHPGLLLFKRSR
jgi:hypothetical protein